MSDNPLALIFDFGTQSVRVSLVDKYGEIVGQIKKPYDPPYYVPKKGYAEQSPDFYWDYACRCLKELDDKYHYLFNNIVGATIATFRDTAVLLNKDYKPLKDCVMWFDERSAEGKAKTPFMHKVVFSLVGMLETIELNKRRTIAQWYQENDMETWVKVDKYVNISTYLTYKLTGKLVDSAASMIGHYPFHFKKREWYKNDRSMMALLYGVKKSQLAVLYQPGEVMGEITDEIAETYHLPKGIKVYASGSDKACETIGLGALDKDTAAVSYGTASTIEVSNTKYHEPVRFLPAYPAALPGYYNMDVQIYRGYWMLKWFSEEFAHEELTAANLNSLAVEEILNEKLLSIPPGSDGLVLQPYWGPDLKRPLMKGSILGFTSIHTKYHLYRAIIEGIAYALREALESIQKSQHHKVSSIRISGGGSQSDAICQITADIFGLPVSRVQTMETTTLGEGMCVMIASGVYSGYNEAVEAMVRKGDTFIPNEENHKTYNYLFNHAYLKMFPKLKGIYKDLKKHRDEIIK